MADALVRYTPQNGNPPRDLSLRINGPDANFTIGTEKIATWSVAAPDPFLLDLLDIAASVFAADRSFKRGGDTREGVGRDWRRRLDFQLAVRVPRLWSRGDVTEALTDAVSFLTDDIVSFQFEPGRTETPSHDYLPLGERGAGPMGPGHVILFSGGLDSLAGAIETLERTTDNVILVTHRSAQKMIPFQDGLVAALPSQYRKRVRYIPIDAKFRKLKSHDTTQRSRSFLFAAFGFVIARLVGADSINFFENGVVSHNLPISPQVIGTMATRTTHPLALAKLEHLLSLIHGSRFPVRNPFALRTKTEVVASLRDHGAVSLISKTSSCNHVWKRSTEMTHCGACSQCLDRRFAILAADLADADPESHYETPVLTGAHERPRNQTMVVDWARHALRLADISQADFATRFMGELARIVGHVGAISAGEAMRRCHELQKRHGAAVKRVLVDQSRKHAEALLDGSLPENSLLRALLAQQTGRRVPLEAALAEGEIQTPLGDPEPGCGMDDARLWPLRVAMFHDGSDPVLEVMGLGTVRGMPAAPAHSLRPLFEEDCLAGRKPQDHRFASPGSLCPHAGKTPNAVAKNVQRCRNQLAELYRVIEGADPEDDLLIESASWNGYRLDPEARLVPADEEI